MSGGIQYGGFWRRFFAMGVDLVCFYALLFGFLSALIVIAFVLIVQLGGLGTLFPEQFYELALASAKGGEHNTTFTPSPLTQLVLNIVFGLTGFAYWAGMESSSKQATFGKRMFGLKVTGEEGFRIGFWHACGRYLAKVLSFLTLLIGFLMAAFTEKKQALHDKVGKTLVIREGLCFFWPTIKIVIFSILFIIVMALLLGLSVRIVAGGNIIHDPEAKQQILNRFFAYDKVDISGLSDETKNEVFESPTADSQDYEDPPVAEETFDLENNKESACPDESFTSTPLEQREDGLIYMINEDSPYTGVVCLYYESGAKREVSDVVEGRYHGSYEIWYENGNKHEHFNFEHGIPHGSYETWYENGNKEKEVNIGKRNLVNNLFEGPYVLYFENGQLSETGTYVNSKLQGQTIFWDEEGNFTKSQIYENGELLETSTTPPENLSEVVNFLTTDLQDHEVPAPTEETFDLENNNDAASLNAQLKESFHENGVKKMEAHYVDGKLNGSSTLWDEYVQKIIIVNYKEDKRHGLLTRWHNNGQKKIEINYTDDKRDGEMTFWNENGDIKKILTYSNGELIEKEREYD